MKPPELCALPSGSGTAALNVIEDVSGFRSLWRDWQILHGLCQDATPFNSWEWLFSWWQSYGGNRQLRILTWWNGPSLVGVAPLYLGVERTDLRISCRVLRFVGDGSFDSDYLGMLVLPEAASKISQGFSEWLRINREWDAIALREQPEKATLPELLKSEADSLGYLARLEYSSSAILDLPSTFDEFLRSRPPRFRTKLRSLLKKLDEGTIRFEPGYERSLQLRHRLRSLFSLHQMRWAAAGGLGVFDDPRKRLFYIRFVPRFARTGWLRFYSLRIGQQYVAHQLCFGGGGVTYLLQEGFDVSNPAASYGQMLRAAVMRHLIEKGERQYDFLGGFTKHKEDWGAREGKAIHFVGARSNWRGSLYFRLPIWRERLAGPAKRILPAVVLSKLRQAVAAAPRGQSVE